MADGRMRIGVVLPIAQVEADGQATPYATLRAIAIAAEGGRVRFGLGLRPPALPLRRRGERHPRVLDDPGGDRRGDPRVELGTLVMCTGFRNPALLAKMAATLDHVSGGRLILGIGAGWHDPEYEAFGYPTDHKVGRFEESLAVITGLIREGRADLDGRYVTARDAVLLPPARPDMPILVAAKRPADARADGAPRRCLEPRLVRAPGRAAGTACAGSWPRPARAWGETRRA